MAPVIAPPGILRRIDTTVELNVVFFSYSTVCDDDLLF